MEDKSSKAQFVGYLRKALASLYDPAVLRNSPLAQLLDVEPRRDKASALRRALIDAIESLRPNENTPQGSKTWRVYQVLRRRYTEQLTQREVASNLGLSIRQLQREEKLAREVLADYLWTAHRLETKVAGLTASLADAGDQASLTEVQIPTRAQELEWLRSSVPAEMIKVEDVIQEVLETLGPLLESSKVSVAYAAQEGAPAVSLQVPMLRQALVNVVSTAVRYAPGGQVRIVTEVLPRQVCIQVSAAAHTDASSPKRHEYPDSLAMTRRLLHLCQGSLEITSDGDGDEVFTAKVVLPLAEQVTVLVIDDNADTLQLFRRYLTGSRYRFVGAQEAERGLALAEELDPRIVVLDVMMPEKDGWSLLGQLREHPKTRDIPVVVCTILSQEQLALTLGAADFIRKPVRRTEFLSVLGRQLDPSPKKP